MRLDDSFRDRETKPDAAAIRTTRLPELPEHVRQLIGRNTGAGVRNLNAHLAL